MPPLICPSPAFLDQSFPKNIHELQAVAISLGELERLLEDDSAHILVSKLFEEWTLDYEWSPPENCQILNTIYVFVNHLLLSTVEGVIKLDLKDVNCSEEETYPTPECYDKSNKIKDWCSEMGKIFKLHQDVRLADEYFIGIACELGFSGGVANQVPEAEKDKSFPIVGINDLQTLSDAYCWITNAGDVNREISFNVAKKNVMLLGATKISNPRSGSSHYPVTFAGARRPWVLDKNDDPVPFVYLKELEPIAKYPIEVIVHVLLYTKFPPKRLKIPEKYTA